MAPSGMRINQYVARASGLSRRAADTAVTEGRVVVDGRAAGLGDQVTVGQAVTFDGKVLELPADRTIMLHKPAGYVTSRRQQGDAPTIYALLPQELHHLKPVGRLDRATSGLLLLTNDGALAQQLQHPSSGKVKRYEVWLDQPLQKAGLERLRDGVELEDGLSRMNTRMVNGHYIVELQEGRNRQIRRSFAALNRRVTKLHRTNFGPYTLGDLPPGNWRELQPAEVAL